MEAPTPSFLLKPKENEEKIDFEIKKEVISDKNKKYLIVFEATSSINIKAIHEDIINTVYEGKFTIEQIKKNKYFFQFDDLKEICEELKGRIENDKISLIETTNSIVISIPLPSSKIKEIVFELSLNDMNDKEKIKYLIEYIKEQKEEIEKFKKEIKDLTEFKKEMSFLLNYYITNMDSLIINEMNKNITLKNWISPKYKIKSNLLYRLTRDGSEISTFHNLCDNKGPTLSLFHLEIGDIIGFFVSKSFDSKSGWVKDDKCFIFNLSKNQICRKSSLKNQLSFYCKFNCGPSANGLGCNPDEKVDNLYHSANSIDTHFLNNASKLLPSEGVEKRYKAIEIEIFQINIDGNIQE